MFIARYIATSYFTCTLKFLTRRREAPIRCTGNIKTLSVDPPMSTKSVTTESGTAENVDSLVKLIVSVALQLFTQLFSLVKSIIA